MEHEQVFRFCENYSILQRTQKKGNRFEKEINEYEGQRQVEGQEIALAEIYLDERTGIYRK